VAATIKRRMRENNVLVNSRGVERGGGVSNRLGKREGLGRVIQIRVRVRKHIVAGTRASG
jgi:hypothetical protein